MKRPEKKETPRDNGFDRADYDVPIEVEAFNKGYNQSCDDHDPYIKELKEQIKLLKLFLENTRNDVLMLTCIVLAQGGFGVKSIDWKDSIIGLEQAIKATEGE